MAVLASAQIFKPKLAKTYSLQPDHLMSDCLKHAANLTVAAFKNRNRNRRFIALCIDVMVFH